MRQQKRFQIKAVSLLFVLFLQLCGGLFPVLASSGASRTIRVAYPIQKSITDMDENGKYYGYTYEYLEEIAQYTGWNYEFVQVAGSLDEQLVTLMEMVENGQVDLMGAMLYSEDMGKRYDYSGYSYGTAETVLQVLNEGGQSIIVDSQEEQTLRVAVYSTSGRMVQELNEYCEMNLITPELIECSSNEEMVKALEEGRADVLLNTSMNHLENVRTVIRFAPKPFYFVTSKNSDSNLIAELNEAIVSITEADPYFQTTLYEKYFAPASRAFVLSEKDKAYISRAGVLRVGVMESQPPFQYKDEKTGEFQGIGVDLLKNVSQATGLQFSMVGASSWEELYTMAKNGQVDLIAGMPYDYTTARERNLAMSRPYLSSPYTLLMHEEMSEDSIQGKRLALSRMSTYDGYFLGTVVPYDSVDECIRAVNRREADYTYVDTYTAQYYLNLPGFEDLKMIPQTYTAYRICFGVAKQGDHTLLGLLNKSVLSMTSDDLQSVIYQNIVQKTDFSVEYFIRKNPIPVLVTVGCVFLLIVALLVVILLQRIRAGKAISLELQKHVRLYSIANDAFFEYDFKKKDLMLKDVKEKNSSKGDILRYDLGHLFDADSPEGKSQRLFLETLNSAQNHVQEMYVYCRDGNWHWIRVTVETICDSAGAPVYAIGKTSVIDEEKNERESLREQARRDSLTHLYNNETSKQLIGGHLAELRPGEKGALLLLDVDSFKSINDTYGHMRGDEILKSVARLLQSNFRVEDVIGRPGGDEFLVYLPRIRDKEALAKKCTALCEAMHQVVLDAQQGVTISLGAALSYAGMGYEELYRQADGALYSAKEAGRDRFQLAHEENTDRQEEDF